MRIIEISREYNVVNLYFKGKKSLHFTRLVARKDAK